MHSRREFNTLALAGVAACCLPGLAGSAAAMVVRGVKIGLITGSPQSAAGEHRPRPRGRHKSSSARRWALSMWNWCRYSLRERHKS